MPVSKRLTMLASWAPHRAAVPGAALRQGLRYLLFAAGACVLAIAGPSCKPVEKDLVIDDLVYGIDTIPVYASAAEKTRLKSESQFLGTAYANLYLQPIGSSTLNELALVRLANGDKGLIGELVLENFLNDPTAQATMPSNADMRADLDAFVESTYLRFFQRLPGAYEQVAVRRLIEADPDMDPIDVYRAFINSNEYLYY